MSLRQIAVRLVTLVALAQLAPLAQAQHEIHHVPPWISPDGNRPDLMHPFVDPSAFPSDWQFFAPAEIGDFGGQEYNYGFFATYDRFYIWVSRPEYDVAYTDGDFTWGNRFELGYMSESNNGGWLMEFWHIDGPNVYFETVVERVNVLQELDEINGNPQNIDLRSGGGGAATNPQTNGVPLRDRNNRRTQARDYILQDSQNVADLENWEINKTFRKFLHHGSVMEPFFGFRYMKFQDIFRRDFYSRIDGTTGAIVGQVPPTTQDPTDLDDELYQSFQSLFDNHMVGGQFGLRWFKIKGRWNLSTEIRAFAFQNFQDLQQTFYTELTFYDGVGVGAEIDGVFESREQNAFHSSSFVFGGEVRAEAAYEVTRDLALRVGMTYMNLGKGIGRGPNINNNSEDVQFIGATFGIDYKR